MTSLLASFQANVQHRAMDDTNPKLSGDQVIWGAADMFIRHHGAGAAALIAQRIESLDDEGDELGSALYRAILERIGEMARSTASH